LPLDPASATAAAGGSAASRTKFEYKFIYLPPDVEAQVYSSGGADAAHAASATAASSSGATGSSSGGSSTDPPSKKPRLAGPLPRIIDLSRDEHKSAVKPERADSGGCDSPWTDRRTPCSTPGRDDGGDVLMAHEEEPMLFGAAAAVAAAKGVDVAAGPVASPTPPNGGDSVAALSARVTHLERELASLRALSTCVSCACRPSSVVLLRCGHTPLCETCAVRLVSAKTACTALPKNGVLSLPPQALLTCPLPYCRTPNSAIIQPIRPPGHAQHTHA
jgi:hypothetical protein